MLRWRRRLHAGLLGCVGWGGAGAAPCQDSPHTHTLLSALPLTSQGEL